MGLDLSVQVVNFRTRAYLEPCLTSLLAALDETSHSARVGVYDNASGDDLSDLESRFAGRVQVVFGERNLGFGGAQNRLAAGADAAWICCVNPDVVADRHVFARLLGAACETEAAVLGPMLRTTGGEPQRWDHGELHGLRARIANGAGHAHWRPRADRGEVAWVSGAFLLARADAFAAAGGFDEGFFLYKEEEDLCLRIRRNGGRVLYVPEAQATHVGGVVARRDPGQLAASTARYVAKNLPRRRQRLLESLYNNVTRRI
jgi:GT2 family glycosyltransferase